MMSVSALFLLSLCISAVLSCTGNTCPELLSRVRLPEGFEIDYYVQHAANARSIFLSPSNILYIGSRNAGSGQVYAALDRDNDGVAEEVIVLISGLTEPNGIAFRDGNLWVVDMTRIIRFDDIDAALTSTGKAPEPSVLRNDLPSQGNHAWRYAAFNPDTADPYLYIAIGADCNICLPDDPFATIARLDSRSIADAQIEYVAYGVRNSVGFSWHPITGELWFTDNGRDQWGNDIPGDELNRITKNGLHYGFPYCYEKDLVDSTYNTEGNCDAYVPASQVLGPHVAAIGNTFYTGSSFPQDYFLNFFIAEHGSWNRAIPIGYRVTKVVLNEEGTAPISGSGAYTVFADGWLPDGATSGSQAWGRPVDIKQMKDGSILVSDDRNNCVYRIRYVGEASSASKINLKLILIILLSVAFGIAALKLVFLCLYFFYFKETKKAAAVDSAEEKLMETQEVQEVKEIKN